MKLETRGKEKIKRYLRNLSVLAFTGVMILILYEIYNSYQKPVTYDHKVDLTPISQELYLDLAASLSSKKQVDQAELNSFRSSIFGGTQVVYKQPVIVEESIPLPPETPLDLDEQAVVDEVEILNTDNSL